MTMPFGRAAREMFTLDPDGVFLNHGSFGTAPRSVQAAQQRWRDVMERQPDIFFRRLMRPGIRAAAETLAPSLGAKGEDMAFVENPTQGINTVLQRLSFKPGDEILIANTTYNAVRLSVDDVCRRFGAKVRVVTLPLPMTNARDVVELFAAAASSHTRIAILDHIVSPTGFILPVAEITSALKAKGALVMIDGAHSAGQIPLNIEAIGADWYTGTLHKWMFMPKGSAYLWASRDVHAQTIPLMVSHWVADGFPRAFDYTGTRDSTAWLCLPDALEFQLEFGADRVMVHNKALALAGAALFAKIGLEPAASPEHFGAMQSMILPTHQSAQGEDAVVLMAEMWDRHRVQVASGVVGGRLLLRVSAQVYCTLDDYAQAVEALDEMSWPGRA